MSWFGSAPPSILPKLEECRADLMRLPYVVSVGLAGGGRRERVVVGVTENTPSVARDIKSVSGDLPVEIRQVTPITLLSKR